LALAVFLAAAAAFAQSTADAPAASATIHADRPGPAIDRHIYGQFAEHLGRGIYEGVWVGEKSPIPNVRGIRSDVVAALRDLHVPVVRWPGGCFADEYHWRDGIGPRAGRPVTLNTNWGGVPETNEFGTHEFMDFADMIGSEAYINGNLGTGSPREMAEWLQYLTSDKPTALTAERARNGHPDPWKIAYFAVGNEAWGCGGHMTTGRYIDLFRQYSNFLKAPPHARPIIIASGGHDEDTSWTEALISQVHEDMGAISFHYYTLPVDDWKAKGSAIGFGRDRWISTLAHTLRMEQFIRRNGEVLDKFDPQKKVAFAVDEWGTWYDPEPGSQEQFLYQQNTLRDALVAALNLNIFHQHADRMRLANIAQMVNVLQAMILTQGPRMVLTPTYHVFHLFTPFQDSISLPIELTAPRYALGDESVPAVSMSAARTRAGAIAIALVNLDPDRPLPMTIGIDGAAVHRVSGQVLSAATMDARNTFDDPNAVRPAPLGATLKGTTLILTLPAKSVMVAVVD
jgi:alpha-L-arabinofuranosidase